MDIKANIGDPKTGKTAKKEFKDEAAKRLLGLKIGDTVKGELLDLPGYEFEVTGGSDTAGFPMRKDVAGTGRKRILLVSGVGLKPTVRGLRRRKSVAGNTVSDVTAQINLKVLKHGKEPLTPPEEKKEEKKE